MSRNAERAPYSTEAKVAALNTDVDTLEALIVSLTERLDDAVRYMQRAFIGMLITIATSAVGFAITVVVLTGGK